MNKILPLASLFIIIGGLKLASGVVLPLLMAFFLFIIFFPLTKKLQFYKIPNVLITFIILGIIIIFLTLFISFFTTSGNAIVKDIATYQDKFYQNIPILIKIFEQYNINLDWNNIISFVEPMKLVQYTTLFFKNMGGMLLSISLTLILLMFLLLEAPLIDKKIQCFAKNKTQKQKIDKFIKSINRYFIIKTFTSALTAFSVWLLLKYFNLNYAFLFALIAFVLNYIPSIGSIIAGFPPLFVSLLQLGAMDSFFILIGYAVINIFIGNFLDPKIMGKDLGISTFIVFLSMIVWGWIFGPIGMLLAVPLTLVIKIIAENNDKYNWISTLLQDNIEENRCKN